MFPITNEHRYGRRYASTILGTVSTALLLGSTTAVAGPLSPALEGLGRLPALERLTSLPGAAENISSQGSGEGSSEIESPIGWGQDHAVQAGDKDPFYDTSTLTPGAPGTILRTQVAPTALMPPGIDLPLPSSVTKVIYSTVDAHDAPIAVSGYLVEPSVPWTGTGKRPTVVVGRGTVGQGDQCAPSRNWPVDNQPDPFSSGRMVALEGLYDWAFGALGVRVFVTDYVGMGTPGMHTYMNRDKQAHAMIDGARTARNLAGAEDFGKIAFYGHSQGGGASTAAIEAAPSYGSDLDVAGAYASAPPADLEAVQRGIEGSHLVGAVGFTINGLVARYPTLEQELDRHLSPSGKETLQNLSHMCTNEIEDAYGGQTTRDWTVDSRSLDEILGEFPAGQAAMNDQRIGEKTPNKPVMIVAGKHDGTVAYQQSKDLAGRWCEAGAQVVYRDDILPEIKSYNHFLQAVSGAPFGLSFVLKVLNDVPVGGCNAPDAAGGSGSSSLPDLPGLNPAAGVFMSK